MRSASVAALLVMAFCFLLIGLGMVRWELISLVIPLVMVLYLAYLLNRPPVMRVTCSRSMDTDRLQEGEEVEVTLRLRNEGEALDHLEVKDTVPPGAKVVAGREGFPIRLGKGEEAVVSYRLSFPRRGYYRFGDLMMSWHDPSMLVSLEQRVAMGSRVVVLPKVEDLRRCDLRPTRLQARPGSVPSAALGPGTDFFCLRDYTDTDPMRYINWKSSAKRGKLLVNDFQVERSGDVVLLLDARTALDGPEVRSRLLDIQVDAATSLASHFLKQRDRVGLLMLGEVFGVIPLSTGKRQFYRIFDELLSARPAELRSTTGVGQAIGRFFPTSPMVVAITSLEDEKIMTSLEGLGQRGYDVVVLSPDWFALEGEPTSEGDALAQRMHRIRRIDMLAELTRYCRVIDWDPSTPLSKHLMGGRAWFARRA
ncbi:MAG: DUF58 domain-containing protein [Methanomassiliicoccales archaeon]|nr:DUF58 domain-containing protein [Methanomassiliicoccales archaeon]